MDFWAFVWFIISSVCTCVRACVCLTGVTANSVHPGLVMTEVMRHYNFMVRFLFNMIGIFFFKVNILNHNTLVKIIHTVHCLTLTLPSCFSWY